MKSLKRLLTITGLAAVLALAINVGLGLQRTGGTANQPPSQAVSYTYLLEQRNAPLTDSQVWETTMIIALGVLVLITLFGMFLLIGLGLVNPSRRRTGRMPRYDLEKQDDYNLYNSGYSNSEGWNTSEFNLTGSRR
jgi:hypothetical protein